MSRFHSRSSSKSSRQKKHRAGQKKPAVKFRTGVPAEQVDHLLKEFIKTVKTGLDLILSKPSDLTRKVLKENPLWLVSSEMNLVLVTWAAFAAWDKSWAEFCQKVLVDPQWQALLAATDQATLDERQAQFGKVVPRLVELAVHDALKAGDQQDNRAAADKKPVKKKFSQRIGVAQVLKRLDKADRRRQAHRPRTYLTRSFILADLLRWLLHLPSTEALIRHLEDFAHLAGAVREASNLAKSQTNQSSVGDAWFYQSRS